MIYRLCVTDTETTGMDPADQVCELGIVTIHWDSIGLKPLSAEDRWSTLIRPTVPVKPEARAAHHLTDAELASAFTVDEHVQQGGFPQLYDGPFVFVAHNAEFDLRMLRQSGVHVLDSAPVICTYQCAKHLWSDAPSYKNQVLRYWLGLDEKYGTVSLLDTSAGERVHRTLTLASLPPHRALADCVVTAALLREMLTLKTVEELIEMTRTPVLQKNVPFGKYRGQPWSAMDRGYLNWILGKEFDEETMYAARYWRDGPPTKSITPKQETMF